MDICFHYFAVKTVAYAAGFSEAEAQRIAQYSQFIDDYNWYVHRGANNIPEEIRNDSTLDIIFSDTFNIINPVTTGFYDMMDMATLILSRSQKYTVSPFHFVPQNDLNVRNNDRRTVPASYGDGSYISQRLSELKTEFTTGQMERQRALMKLGMLLHTFADTYAHQLFSGYSESVNRATLLKVYNNITNEDETKTYKSGIIHYIKLLKEKIGVNVPAIGHLYLNHIPDLTHLSFEFKYTNPEGVTCNYTRSNTTLFVQACEEIYKYLRSILGDGTIPRMDWDTLYPMLADAFLFDASTILTKDEHYIVEQLSRHWNSIFSTYSYSYDSNALKNSFVLKQASEARTVNVDGKELSITYKSYSNEFYQFNILADKYLISLYGPTPRYFFSNAPTEE